MFVCCEYCALSGRGLCDELITRPGGSYRLLCVVVCDLETTKNPREYGGGQGPRPREKKMSDLNWGELLRLLNSLIQPETQITTNTVVYDFTQITKLQHLQKELLGRQLYILKKDIMFYRTSVNKSTRQAMY